MSSNDLESQIRNKLLETAAKNGVVNLIRQQENYISRDFAKLLLFFAARSGQRTTSEFLIDRFNLKVTETEHRCRKTPLHYATVKGDREMAQLFVRNALQERANEFYKFTLDGYGGTVLQAAAFYGNLDFVKVLYENQGQLSNDLQLDFKDWKGDTAFMLAARNNQVEMLKFLKDKGANFVAVNVKGYSALHHAARLGHIDAARYLVKYCPDAEQLKKLKLRDNIGGRCAGFTALQLAAFYRNEEIVNVLKETPQEQPSAEADNLDLIRMFLAYKDFLEKANKVASNFGIFNPFNGIVGGRDGVIPYRQAADDSNENQLAEIFRLSIVALSATFEKFCVELGREAFERAVNLNKMKRKWIVNMLQDMISSNDCKFTWTEFKNDGKTAGEKLTTQEKILVVSAARDLMLPEQSNRDSGAGYGNNVSDFLLKYRLVKQMPIEIQPTLENNADNSINRKFVKLFKWDEKTLEKCLQRLRYAEFYNFVLLSKEQLSANMQGGFLSKNEVQKVVLKKDNAFAVLDKLTRLFYGMRCLFAHGIPEKTKRNTLRNLKFYANDFDGQHKEKIARYFDDVAQSISDPNRECAVTYCEYLACLRFYKFFALVLQTCVLLALEIWREGDANDSEFEEQMKDEALGDVGPFFQSMD